MALLFRRHLPEGKAPAEASRDDLPKVIKASRLTWEFGHLTG
jgi:hypothetical protein